MLLAVQAVCAQAPQPPEADLEDRPISSIRIEGVRRVDEQLVRNQLRSAIGDPFDWETTRADVRLLNRLGEFKTVDAFATLQSDGSVSLTFRVVEQELITAVQVVGNRVIPDQDLRAVAPIEGSPRDDFLIENSKRAMRALYRERGHYLTTISVDESELQDTGILLFRIVEGPRVKVKAIEFEGNQAFTATQLHAEIGTRTAVILFRRGELDEEKLTDDVAALDRFYKDRGYLDVRIGHRVELSPHQTEAKVVFPIIEGQQFTLRSVRTEPDPLRVFSTEQLTALLQIKPGDVYSQDKIRKSIRVVRDAYAKLGYLLSMPGQPSRSGMGRIDSISQRTPDGPVVDLVLIIDESTPWKVGNVDIQGDTLTRDKVIRRHVRGIRPGRPLDVTEVDKAIERLRRTRLFNDVHITVQDPDPSNPGYRDVLVDVKERNTGSVGFGVAVGSDAGVFGELSLVQRNFDITDYPESVRELLKGRAFRGAGQQFSAILRPGDELFQYLMSFTEPYLFETNNSLRVAGSFRDRQFRRYDEERVTLSLSLGRRFGDVWNVSVNTRFEQVELDNIDAFAPTAIFDDAGPNNLTSFGLGLTRTTVGTLTRPGRGSRLEFSLDQSGLLGGDFDFTTASAEYTVFLTLREDFLGRKSILKLNTRVGYIFGGDAPLYERFYLGGRSFRGFDFREVSPKGIRADNGEPSDDPIGGNWLLFAGAQYEVPLISENLTGVVFLDTGTVTDDLGFDQYRASIGVGLRIYIPQFGPIPIAFDFAIPLLKEEGDDTQVLSFSAELPF
ncbi:MAG: outer membrane protein assembly factor BamA [Phycisphaerales bacterium]